MTIEGHGMRTEQISTLFWRTEQIRAQNGQTSAALNIEINFLEISWIQTKIRVESFKNLVDSDSSVCICAPKRCQNS